MKQDDPDALGHLFHKLKTRTHGQHYDNLHQHQERHVQDDAERYAGAETPSKA